MSAIRNHSTTTTTNITYGNYINSSQHRNQDYESLIRRLEQQEERNSNTNNIQVVDSNLLVSMRTAALADLIKVESTDDIERLSEALLFTHRDVVAGHAQDGNSNSNALATLKHIRLRFLSGVLSPPPPSGQQKRHQATSASESTSLPMLGLCSYIETSPLLEILELGCSSKSSSGTILTAGSSTSLMKTATSAAAAVMDAAEHLWDPLLEAVSRNPNIHTLHIPMSYGFNPSSSSLAKLLGTTQTLKRLLFAGNEIAPSKHPDSPEEKQEEDLRTLVNAISTNASVEEFTLHCGRVGPQQAPFLATLLFLPCLQVLHLKDLRPCMVQAFQRLLLEQSPKSSPPRFVKLKFSGTPISSEEEEESTSWLNLFDGLRQCPQLSELIIHVQMAPPAALHFCRFVVETTTIKTVEILQTFTMSHHILLGMAQNTSVVDFQLILQNVTATPTTQVTDALVQMMQQNATIANLHLSIPASWLESFAIGLSANRGYVSLTLMLRNGRGGLTSSDGIDIFFQALRMHPTLAKLETRLNGGEWASQALAQHLGEESCSLVDVTFRDNGDARRRNRLPVNTMLINALPTARTLKRLELCEQLQGPSIEALVVVLPKLTLLESLVIRVSPSCVATLFRDLLYRELSRALEMNNSLLDIHILHRNRNTVGAAVAFSVALIDDKEADHLDRTVHWVQRRNRYIRLLEDSNQPRSLWPRALEALLSGAATTTATTTTAMKGVSTAAFSAVFRALQESG